MQAVEAGAEMVGVPLDGIGGTSTIELHTGEGDFAARTLIIATGSDIRTLGVPGEERLKGKGVSHCASCDAPMLREAIVAVVGGGDSAMQEALTIAAHASRVVMLVRGDALGGQAVYRTRIAETSNIEVRTGVSVTEIVGDEGVTGVRLSDGTTLETPAVFAYAGLVPNTAFLGDRLGRDDEGRLEVDALLACTEAGYFAAGSVRSGWAGRAAASAGDGATAAVAADRFLRARA
jgi:thioredoxin reductase (NADPH)